MSSLDAMNKRAERLLASVFPVPEPKEAIDLSLLDERQRSRSYQLLDKVDHGAIRPLIRLTDDELDELEEIALIAR